MINKKLNRGDKVECNWGKLGWLPAVFLEYNSPDDNEDFERCKVKMDNGFPCEGSGYHPDAVRIIKDGR